MRLLGLSFGFPHPASFLGCTLIANSRRRPSRQIRTLRSQNRLSLDACKILHVGLERTEALDLLEFRRFECPLTGDFIHGGVSGPVANRDEPSGREPAGTGKQIGKMRVLVPGVEGGLMCRIDIDPDDMDEGLIGHHCALKPDEYRRRGAPCRPSLQWRHSVRAAPAAAAAVDLHCGSTPVL